MICNRVATEVECTRRQEAMNGMPMPEADLQLEKTKISRAREGSKK